jgi:hypothetical protein
MRIPANMTDDELREAHRAADTLTTDKYRAYLPGRLLPLLIARFRDDVAEALGMQLPSLPQRSAVRAVKLDDLTSAELDTLTGSVVVLVTRFAACMDDPALAPALRDFRDALVIEKADRARIADELMEKARAS